MIKLVFNKETKVISTYEVNEEEIQEQKEIQDEKSEKKVIQAKIFFEKYKIFFEIFSTVLLGIMSLIISFVGWQTNQRSVEIYQKQLEIQQEQSEIQRKQLTLQLEQSEIQSEIQKVQSEMQQKQLEIQTNDREPFFTIYNEDINDNELSYNKSYIVKNEGGKINDGFLGNINAILTIQFGENDNNIYYCEIDKAFFTENSYPSLYDKDNKEFVFGGYDYLTYGLIAIVLEMELNSIYENTHIYVTFNSYLTMRFTDYKNEEYLKTYNFTENDMEYVNYDYKEGKKYLGSMEYGEKNPLSFAHEIYEKIENFQE